MIDTHAHLDACADPAEVVLERAREAGVDTVVAIGCGLERSCGALELARREPGVHCAIGFHPHDAADVRDGDLDELRRLLAEPGAVAVGEAGLDHYRDYAPRDSQRAVFAAQVSLAVELGKPLVVHSRAADEETLELLEPATGRIPIVLHCFSSPGLIGAVRERGYYASFAGNVTYPAASELRTAAAQVPVDRLLAETDCPYLSPQPVRGRTNEPAYVVHVLAGLAAARSEDPAELEQAIVTNARRAFLLP